MPSYHKIPDSEDRFGNARFTCRTDGDLEGVGVVFFSAFSADGSDGGWYAQGCRDLSKLVCSVHPMLKHATAEEAMVSGLAAYNLSE